MREDLRSRYRELVLSYVARPDESFIYYAHALGRECIQDDVLPEEIELLHLELVDADGKGWTREGESLRAQRILHEVTMVSSVAYRELTEELQEAKEALEENNRFKTLVLSFLGDEVRENLNVMKVAGALILMEKELSRETQAKVKEIIETLKLLESRITDVSSLVKGRGL